MLRIAITDDHSIFRASLAALIHSFEGMEVVLEASNGKELLEKLESTKVDVLLLDIQMPIMDGFETFPKVREAYPQIKTIVLSLVNEMSAIKKMLQMGVQGYYTKNTSSKELEEAIRNIEEDGFFFEKGLNAVIQEVLEAQKSDIEEDKGIQFTERELEVIKLTAQGLKAKDIAEQLHISLSTVNNHKQNIQRKYGFESMMNAILYCVYHGVVDLDTIFIEK